MLAAGLVQREPTVSRRSILGTLTVLVAWTDQAIGQSWHADDHVRLSGLYAEWTSTTVVDAAGSKVMRMRLWLGDDACWALLVDAEQDDALATVGPASGWQDCGVHSGIHWELSYELLRNRPASSLRRGLRETDRDPSLAGAMLQLGHFLWRGGHLATVLGAATGHDEHGNILTATGAVVAIGAAEVRILSNPQANEPVGVTYRYGKPFASHLSTPVVGTVEITLAGNSAPTYVQRLKVLRPISASEVPFPRWSGDAASAMGGTYPRSRATVRQFIDTTGNLSTNWWRDQRGEWRRVPIEKSWRHYLNLIALALVSALAWLTRK